MVICFPFPSVAGWVRLHARSWTRLSVALVFLAVLSSGSSALATDGAGENEDVYYIEQWRFEGEHAPSRISAVMPVTWTRDGTSAHLRNRVAWFEASAANYAARLKSTELDPTKREQALLARFLDRGFSTRVSRDRVTAFRPMDGDAMRRLNARHQPPVDRKLVSLFNSPLVLRPYQLPDDLQAGQSIERVETVPQIGNLRVIWHVEALDTRRVQVRVTPKSTTGAQLAGTQILDRTTGMPIQSHLVLTLPGNAKARRASRRWEAWMISQRHSPSLWRFKASFPYTRTQWPEVRQLIDTPAAMPAPQKLMSAEAYAQWIPVLPEPAALAQLRTARLFDPSGRNGFRTTQTQATTREHARPGLLGMPLRVKSATPLDENGLPMNGVTVVVNRMFEMPAIEGWSRDFADALPFGIALSTPMNARQSVESVDVDLDVGGFVAQIPEKIRRDMQSSDPRVRIEWRNDHVADVYVDFAFRGSEEEWFLPVPLDARGKAVLFEFIPIDERRLKLDSAADSAVDPGTVLLPAQWKERWQYRIRTAQPVGGIELRRYRMQWVPQTWRYSNYETLGNKSEIEQNGVHVFAEGAAQHVPYIPERVSGRTLLRGMRARRPAYPQFDPFGEQIPWYIPVREKWADTVFNYCRATVESGAVGIMTQNGSDHENANFWGEFVWHRVRRFDRPGWYLQYAEHPERVRLAVRCPRSIEVVRYELNGHDACFESSANGWFVIKPHCQAELGRRRLIVRNRAGHALGYFYLGESDSQKLAIRPWDDAATVEYLLISEEKVTRNISIGLP